MSRSDFQEKLIFLPESPTQTHTHTLKIILTYSPDNLE